MPAFLPPNPYGSYFNFGEPESLARAAFLPGLSPGASPGVSSAMGSAAGGFNPTQQEAQQSRYRDIAVQQFLARSLAEDPRAVSMGNLALRSMFGSDMGAQSDLIRRMGGRSSFNEMMGFMLNMPGVSGFMGGSQRSLGIGALAAASGGMRLNGYGMFGDGPLQVMMAGGIMRNVQQQFYSPSGAANLGMTAGLNRDQIGGLMMTGGVQGAFAGLDMGKMAMVAGRQQLAPDKGTMDRITQFTKNAAKAIGDLIDVFGDSSVADLLNKSKQITGLDLSRLENAGVMRQRLAGLRNAAQATGQDVQSMYDVAAGSVRMGMAMGLTPAGAGAIAQGAAIGAGFRAREHQLASGSFYMAGASQGEFAAGMVRDAVAMLRDPLGSRRSAVELMIQEGVIGGGAATDLRARMGRLGPGGVAGLDAEVMGKYHINLAGYIASQGGPLRVYEQLNESNKEGAVAGQQGDINRRGDNIIRHLFRQQTQSSRGLPQMLELIANMSTGNLQNLLLATDSGGDLLGPINQDFAGRTNPAKFARLAKELRDQLPGQSLAGLHQSLAHAMSNPNLPFLANYMPLANQMDRADLYFRNAPSVQDGVRGGTRGGLLQGILEKMDARDPASVYSIIAATSPDRIAGLSPEETLSVNPDDFRNPATGEVSTSAWTKQARTIYKAFNRTAEGRKMLAHLGLDNSVNNEMGQGLNRQALINAYDVWINPIKREALLQDFKPFNFNDGTMSFTTKMDVDRLGNGIGLKGMTLSAIGEMMENRGQHTKLAENLRRTGLMMATGKDGWKINPDTRHWTIRSGRILTDAERANINVIGNTMGTAPDLAMQVSLDELRLLGADHDFGQAAQNALFNKDVALLGVRGDDAEKKRAEIRKKEDVLSDLGYVGKTEGVQRIFGTLKILPDKSGMEFVDTVLKDSTAK